MLHLLYVFLFSDLVLCESQAGTEGVSRITTEAFTPKLETGEGRGGAGDVSSDTEEESPTYRVQNRTVSLRNGQHVILFPSGDLYPEYIADPQRPSLSIMRMHFPDTGIYEAGKTRWGLRLGARIGLLRFYWNGDPDDCLQLDVEAGFVGQFDIDHDADNIGWDGIHGLQLSWMPLEGIALRFGIRHDSSHVGDEYAERTGRQRIKYTRGEWLLAASWSFFEKWRAYAETGYAYDVRNEDLMEPLRIQYGLEYVSPHSLWKDRLGWYAASDVSSYEENGWDINATIQAGLILPMKDRSHHCRFGIEYYNGRSHIGEFFLNDEKYLSIGFWFDL